MSRSRKKVICITWVGCKYQKRGKRKSNRRFRRKEHQCMTSQSFDNLPVRPIELMDTWDLGGDGKVKTFVFVK